MTKDFNKRTELSPIHLKYEEAIHLKSSLEKPLAYHSRTIQILPTEASKALKQVTGFNDYANENEKRLIKRKQSHAFQQCQET